MGPVVGVPDELARRIKDDTDLVEVDQVLSDVIDVPDVQVGPAPLDDRILLVEAPRSGYGRLVSVISEYANNAPKPFVMVVVDQHGDPHPFPADADVGDESIRAHLKLACYGEPGDRRPLIRDDDARSS